MDGFGKPRGWMGNICAWLVHVIFCLYYLGQPEPEFRPPMSEVVQALVRLVQRANMSKRTFSSSDHGGSQRGSDEPVLRDI